MFPSQSRRALALHLFGAYRLEVDGNATRIRRRKVMALLAYLAVTQQPHSRETLATLLWPESDGSRARDSLRRHLSSLNRALGKGRLIVDRTNIRLSTDDDLWIDVIEFRELLTRCQSHGHSAEITCPRCLPLLEGAVSLYENDFLRGFTLVDSPRFDEWQSYEMESLRTELAAALEKLPRAYATQGDTAAAIGYVRRWVAMDPLHEPAQQLLIQLYVESGQLVAARREYNKYVEAYQSEFGLPAGQEIKDLYEAARERSGLQSPDRNRPSDGAQREGADLVDRPRTVLVRGPARIHEPEFLREGEKPAGDTRGPFVAREHRIAQLDRYLEAAVSGSGQAVFVLGEAGSGKTTLLQEFVRRAQHTHADLIVAQGTCDVYMGVGDPYLPFRDILQMLSGDVEARLATGTISRDHAVRLWRLMPDTVRALLDSGPDLLSTFLSPAIATRFASQDTGDPVILQHLRELVERSNMQSPDQSRLFEEYTDVLRSIAVDHPLVLLIDDLHWADVSSISLLFHLCRRIPDSRILLAGAYRPEEVSFGIGDRPHPLEQVVDELKSRAGEIEINLDQDMTAEGRLFVDALLDVYPNRLGEEFRKDLFRHGRGHALFTVELLRDLLENGDLVQDQEGRLVVGSELKWETLPVRVEGVIEKRVNRLDGNLRETLTAASVVGERFTAEVLARVQGADAGQVIHQLSSELERKHQLVQARDVRYVGNQRLSRYGFRHHLFQMYLHNSLDSVERAYLHEKVGKAMEAMYREQDADTSIIAGQLARHFEEAGQTEKAIDYRYLAGQRAIHMSANHEAVRHLNRGLALLDSLPERPETLQREIQFRIALGVPVTALNGYTCPEAERVYGMALQLCSGLGDTAQLFPALYGMWRYYVMRSELQTAMGLAQRLMRLAQRVQDRSLAVEAERAIGISHYHLGALAYAREHLEQGVALYEFEEDRAHAYVYGHDPLVSCLGYLARILWLIGYPDQASAAVERLLETARELSHPFSLAHAMTVGGLTTYQLRGEAQHAYDLAQEALVLANELGSPYWIGRATYFSGWALAKQGEQNAGIAQMCKGLSIWRGVGTNSELAYFLGLLAETYLFAGQVQAGGASLDEGFAEMKTSEESGWEAELYRVKGELLEKQGGSDAEVESHYRRAVGIAQQQEARSLELRAAVKLGWLLHRRGRREEAHESLSGIYDWYTEGFDTADLTEAKRLLALIGTDSATHRATD